MIKAIVTILLFSYNSIGQTKSESKIIDSLKQYTYRTLTHFQDGDVMHGNAVFVNASGKIYLLTALHLTVKQDFVTHKILPNGVARQIYIMPKSFVGKINPKNFYKVVKDWGVVYVDSLSTYDVCDGKEMPDFTFLETEPDKIKKSINALQFQFIKLGYCFREVAQKIYFIGYDTSQLSRKAIKINGEIEKSDAEYEDYVYYTMPGSGKGMSGAPIYTFSNNKLVFVGIVSGGYEISKMQKAAKIDKRVADIKNPCK